MSDHEAEAMAGWATVAVDPETMMPVELPAELLAEVYDAGFDLHLERMWIQPGPLTQEGAKK